VEHEFMGSVHAHPARGLLSRLARLVKRDERGVAAVEFALLAPVLVMLFIGIVEICHAVTIDRRVSQAAHSTADLVTQKQDLCTADAADIMNIVGQLLAPYNATPLNIAIIGVRVNGTDTTQGTVTWSYSYNGASAPSTGGTYALPANLIGPGRTGVVSVASYPYTAPIFRHYLPAAFTLQERSILTPRRGCINWCNTSACS